MSKFHSKVEGVTFNNNDGSNRQELIRSYCNRGKNLILKRDSDNPYDSNAVGVWVSAKKFFIFGSGEVQIGYLNSEIAEVIAGYMDRGGTVKAKIADLTGGTRSKINLSVNILITMK